MLDLFDFVRFCGFLVDFFVKRFHMKRIIVVSFLLTAAFILVTVLTHHALVLWIMMPPIGAAVAVGYSTIITLFSNQVGADEQGWVMGVTGAIMALCFGLSALLTGYLANFGAQVPIYLAFAGLGVSGMMMLFVRAGGVDDEG